MKDTRETGTLAPSNVIMNAVEMPLEEIEKKLEANEAAALDALPYREVTPPVVVHSESTLEDKAAADAAFAAFLADTSNKPE